MGLEIPLRQQQPFFGSLQFASLADNPMMPGCGPENPVLLTVLKCEYSGRIYVDLVPRMACVVVPPLGEFPTRRTEPPEFRRGKGDWDGGTPVARFRPPRAKLNIP